MGQPFSLPQSLARPLERALLASGGALLAAPLLLTLLFGLFPALWPGATWLHDTTLVGVAPAHPVPFSWPALLHARYQQGLERTFDEDFPARELLIRLANEGWLRAFSVGGSTTDGEPLAIGPAWTLFHASDLEEYCRAHPPVYSLERFARQLDRLQAECRRRGLAFAVLISPSKAATYPEEAPRAWLDRYEKSPRAYDDFRRVLAAHRIVTVDGQALTLQAKPSALAPLFARGALHWNGQAALLTGNALLAAFCNQGKPVVPMEAGELRLSDEPHGREADLLGVMNLALPWHYPVVEVHLRRNRTPDNARLNAVFVGTSFTSGLVELLRDSGEFAEIDEFFYYRQRKYSHTDGGDAALAIPAPPLDFEREIFSADALVLEINEALLAQAAFAREFVADTLQHVDESPPTHELFAAQDGQPYVWGQELHFQAGVPGEVQRRALTGFSQGEPDGTWTDGTSAAICLLAFPPPGDLILDAEVGALTDPGRRLSQEVEMSVNDEPIGRWEFSAAGFAHRQLVVPRRLLDGTRHVLRFRLMHPVSPAELGLGPDTRRLGLFFLTLRLQVASAMPR